MKSKKRVLVKLLENFNLIPYKIIKLSTGVVCEYYKNGKIKVLN